MNDRVLNYAASRRLSLSIRTLLIAISLVPGVLLLFVPIARGHGVGTLLDLMNQEIGNWESEQWLFSCAVIVVLVGVPIKRSEILRGIGHAGTSLLLTNWAVIWYESEARSWTLKNSYAFFAAVAIRHLCLSALGVALDTAMPCFVPKRMRVWLLPSSRKMVVSFLICWLATWAFAIALGRVLSPSPQRDVYHNLSYFAANIRRYMIVHQASPGRDLNSALRTLMKDDEYRSSIENHCPLILRNRDVRGHPFVYIVDGPLHVRIWSVGKNGTDDGGKNDDVEMDIDLRDLFSRPGQ